MTLMRYDPDRSLNRLRDNINRVFDMTLPLDWGNRREDDLWQPTVDIYTKDGETVVHAELPGIKKEDISVDVKDNVLTIKGKRSSEEEIDEDGYYRKERRFGAFQRSVPLSEAIDPQHVKATYRDGVLTVRMPQLEETGTRRIAID